MTPKKISGSTTGTKKIGSAGRKMPFILAVLLILVVAAWYLSWRTTQARSQAQTRTTTSIVQVQRGDISLTASGSGTLVASQSVNMSFSTSGKVAELNVKLGDMVKTGDVLARLENATDLEANLATAQANLLQAQQNLAALQKGADAALAQAYQDLVTAQATYNKAYTASQRTAASARCSSDVINQYRAALQQATDKLNRLIKQGDSTGAVTVARYDYDTAMANYTYCTSFTTREKTSAQSTLEVAKTDLQDAQDKYDALKAASGIDPDTLTMNETKVETAQTLVDTAQEALDGIVLKAPFDGKITYLAAVAGAIVDTSTFLTIADLSHPTVTVSLDETDMDKLVVGNPATVTFTALPGKSFTGKVSVANPQMVSFGPFRAASGQIELDSESVSELEEYPLGLSATIVIQGEEVKDVLYVPVAGLKQLNNGDYVVMRKGSNGQIAQQFVTIGIQDKTNVEIIDGLKEGDLIGITTSKSSSRENNNQDGGQFMGGGMPMP